MNDLKLIDQAAVVVFRNMFGIPFCTCCLELCHTCDDSPDGRCLGCRSGLLLSVPETIN